MARNRPDDLVGFFGSSLVGFRLYRFGYWVYRWEQFLAGSGEFWLKSGLNLAGSIEIWLKSGWIRRDLAWILSDNGEISLDFVWDA